MSFTALEITAIPGSPLVISVTVNAGYEDTPELLSFRGRAVKTEPVASIGWGYNFHGDLGETFYLTRHRRGERPCWVLWVGDNGSQHEDDRPMFMAGAWVSTADIDALRTHGACKRLTAKRVAATALLYAWIREAHGRDYGFPSEPDIRTSELLPKQQLARLVSLALCMEGTTDIAPPETEAVHRGGRSGRGAPSGVSHRRPRKADVIDDD